MKTQFNVKENGFNEVRKKILLRTIPIVLLAVAGGLAISMINSDDQSVNVLPILIPIIAVVLGFGVWRGIKRQENLFNSYTLTIDDERMIRQQNMTPDVEIPLDQVKEIVKVKEGIITVRGINAQDVINIPTQIDGIEELEARLSEIRPISLAEKKPWMQRYTWLLSIITIGLMMTVYMAEDKILVGFAGTILTGWLTYSFITTQRSKQIDRKTKRGMWLVLIVLFSIVAVTLVKVFGN